MNYNDWLTKRERYTPLKEAVIDTQSGTRYTYQQLNEKANRLAGYLQRQHQLKASDRLAVVSKNSVEYMILFFACAKLGVVLVPLNYRMPMQTLVELITDCKPQLLIYSQEFNQIAREAALPSNLSIDGGSSSLAAVIDS